MTVQGDIMECKEIAKELNEDIKAMLEDLQKIKKLYDFTKWERDVAKKQLEEIGVAFGQDMGDVKMALEKQVAKRVIGIKAKLITRHCPSCQEWAVFELKRGMKFCPSCGQKLDWSEEE